jgi:pyrroline-5-carboxylate reductase
MSINSITIIGGGNLGKAIAEGLIASKFVKPNQITVTRRNLSSLDYLKKQGVKTSTDNKAAIKGASIVLLCVKPFQAKEILKEISINID